MSCSRSTSATCFQSCICPSSTAFFSNNIECIDDGVNIGGATGQVFESRNRNLLQFRTIQGVTGLTVNTFPSTIEVGIGTTSVSFIIDCTANAVAGPNANFTLNCIAYKLGIVTFIRISRASIAVNAQGYGSIGINSITLPLYYYPSFTFHVSPLVIQDGLASNNFTTNTVLRYVSSVFSIDVPYDNSTPFGTVTNAIIEAQTITWI